MEGYSHSKSITPKVARDRAELEFRWRAIQEIAETAARSSERGVELRRASRKWDVSVRTLQRWITEVEKSGNSLNALCRKSPKNTGQRRVFVSRSFDWAYIHSANDADLLPDLRERVNQLIRAAWASPAQRAGWRQVRREVEAAFARYLRTRGIRLCESSIALSQRRIREARFYRIVDIRRHDRKAYDDLRPRIRRRNDLFQPMQQTVMDVKVIDCVVLRSDGSYAWPRMVAFMDTATQRVFRRIFLLPPGEGIRQEHVASTFIEMVSDPLWGFPQQLYRDNGSEFFIFDLIRTALGQLQGNKVPTIINARPYSAASKPIESRFSVFDRFVFSQMPGWTGGNRMRNKVETVGKPPAPYPGTFDEFIREADERIRVLENTPIGSGPLAGSSPMQHLSDHIGRGWRPLLLSSKRLDAAFCVRETRRVSRGYVRIRSEYFRHPSLVTGSTVTIAIPWRRNSMPLVMLPEEGWAQLQPDIAFLPNDIEGARESKRREREHDALVRRLRKQAGHIDLAANQRDWQNRLLRIPDVQPVWDENILPGEKSLGAALSASSGERLIVDRSRDDRKSKETEDLEQYLANLRT